MMLEKVRYEPRLVEEAVFHAMREKAETGSFHHERERIYEITDPDERDGAFKTFYWSYFLRLKLADPIHQALQERPIVVEYTKDCVVARSSSKKHQEAELLVSPEKMANEKDRRSVRILLRPEMLLNPESTLMFLRHEMFHIADMLDPNYAYKPTLPPAKAGPTHDRLIKDRYRVLWDTSIDGRMLQRGWASESIRNQRLIEFARAFPMLGEKIEQEFTRFFDQEMHTHSELAAFALDPVSSLDAALDSRPEATCSLCGFPTYSFESTPESLPPKVIAEIKGDYPGWNPSQGLCIQCADLYRAHAKIPLYQPRSGNEVKDPPWERR